MSPENQVRSTPERTAVVDLTEFSTKRRGPLRRFFYQHPLMMDLTVLLVYLLLSATNAISMASAGRPWLLVVTGIIAVLLVFRRRRPLITLILVSGCELLGLLIPPHQLYSSGLGIIFALYAVAAARGARQGFIATVAVSFPLAGLMVWNFSWLHLPAELEGSYPWVLWIATVGFMVLGNVIATGIGVMVWRDRKHDLELQEWARSNVRLASANERNRIAREMHDVVAHSLSVMIALSDGAQIALDRSPERTGEALQKLSQTGRSALADMQRVLGVLRLEEPVEQAARRPLAGDFTIEDLLAGFRAAGMPLSFSFSGPTLPSDPGFQLTLYRIVQESLTNVLRYARHVSRVQVKILHLHPHVELTVSDDGRAGELKVGATLHGSGQGLIGMRERAAAYAGEVAAGPQISGGWLVKVRLTCPEPGAELVKTNVKNFIG